MPGVFIGSILEKGRVIKSLSGDALKYTPSYLAANTVNIGLISVGEYVVEFWRNTTSKITYIYINGILCGQSADMPGSLNGNHLYMDRDLSTGDIIITDKVTVPVVYNVKDMVNSSATTLYKADYDKKII